MAYVDWSLQGHSIANCNCDFGCPCQFNTLPTHGDCRAMTAVKIDKGHFGDVDLSGLAFCGIDYANEAQRNALLTILSGKETAPGATIFNVFAPTFAKMHDPVFAPIEFYLDLDKENRPRTHPRRHRHFDRAHSQPRHRKRASRQRASARGVRISSGGIREREHKSRRADQADARQLAFPRLRPAHDDERRRVEARLAPCPT